jgi:hypothetical protein
MFIDKVLISKYYFASIINRDFRSQAFNMAEHVYEKYKKDKEKPRILFVFDSLGNTPTEKEMRRTRIK